MKRPAKLLAAIERLEGEVKSITHGDVASVYARELAAIGCSVPNQAEGMVVVATYEDDPPDLAQRRDAKVEELRGKGFDEILMVVVPNYGPRPKDLPPPASVSTERTPRGREGVS